MRFFLGLILAASFAFSAHSQTLNPVKWSFSAEKNDDGTYNVLLTAAVQAGWYIYSQTLDEGGPIPTSFAFETKGGVEFLGKTEENGTKKEGFDPVFEMNVIKYSNKVVFTQKVKASPATKITGTLTYMTCDNERCLPPSDVDFSIVLP